MDICPLDMGPDTLRALANTVRNMPRWWRLRVGVQSLADFLDAHADAWEADIETEKLAHQGTIESWMKESREMHEANASLRKRLEASETNYYDLLMSVGMKYEGETRHETAKRYILEAETRGVGDGQAALAAGESGK